MQEHYQQFCCALAIPGRAWISPGPGTVKHTAGLERGDVKGGEEGGEEEGGEEEGGEEEGGGGGRGEEGGEVEAVGVGREKERKRIWEGREIEA